MALRAVSIGIGWAYGGLFTTTPDLRLLSNRIELSYSFGMYLQKLHFITNPRNENPPIYYPMIEKSKRMTGDGKRNNRIGKKREEYWK